MRIGICARTWGEKGGIGVYTRSVVESMIAIDSSHEYHILHADGRHLGSSPAADNVREVHLPARGKMLWDQWAVSRYANRERLDIVFHAKFTVPFLARCKTATVLHGTERFIHPEFHRTTDLWYFKTVYPRYLRHASMIVAVSERARTDIIEQLDLDPEKVRVAYLAANPVFRPISDAQTLADVTKRFELPERFLLFAGHIYPGKNFSRLLEAFAIVRQSIDIDLVVAGGLRWKYEKDMETLDRLGLKPHVRFCGHVEHTDLAAMYNLAAATVFPSHYESFGLINVEANACGCPLVTSNTGGSPEAAGDAARYVDPLNVTDIADGIGSVLTDATSRETLIQKGFENAKRFSWEKTAAATLEALAFACGRN
jgi:glycosyltransferase involved in cell wall biosynthesis